MTRCVVDASALVALLLDPGALPVLADGLRAGATAYLAPALCDIEVASAFRNLERRGAVTERRARAGLAVLADLPVERVDHRSLLPRILDLRQNFSAYDAAYVALAEALAAPLVTRDRRLAQAVRRHTSVTLLQG